MRPLRRATAFLLSVVVVTAGTVSVGLLVPRAIGAHTSGPAPLSGTAAADPVGDAGVLGASALGAAIPDVTQLLDNLSAQSTADEPPVRETAADSRAASTGASEPDTTGSAGQTPPAPGPTTPPRPGNADAAASAAGPAADPPASGSQTAAARPSPQPGRADAGATPEPRPLQRGDSGAAVLQLQHRLQALGYWLGGANGTYDHLTRQAVLAFQGVEGLTRDGVVGSEVRAALSGAQRPTAATQMANGIEIDLDRQVLKVIRNGRVDHVFHTSTGTGERYLHPDGTMHIAATPEGSYTIERRIDGWRESSLGRLYRPAYFVGGIAIHGFQHVPRYPASHGCVRVTMEAMDYLWSHGIVDRGQPVVVH